MSRTRRCCRAEAHQIHSAAAPSPSPGQQLKPEMSWKGPQNGTELPDSGWGEEGGSCQTLRRQRSEPGRGSLAAAVGAGSCHERAPSAHGAAQTQGTASMNLSAWNGPFTSPSPTAGIAKTSLSTTLSPSSLQGRGLHDLPAKPVPGLNHSVSS